MTVLAAAAVVALAGFAFVSARAVRAFRRAHYPDLQGAWEGGIGSGQLKGRLVFKLSKANGVYSASEDNIDRGIKDSPVDFVAYDFPSIRFQQNASGFSYRARLNDDATEMRGTWWQRGSSGSLVLKRTAQPDTVPDPLTEADYAPRTGSDLQGYWKASVNVGPNPLDVALKIAEISPGTFRAEGEMIGRPGSIMPASAVSYNRPKIRIEFGGAGGVYEGEVNGNGAEITGAWTQGGEPAMPVTFTRSSPPASRPETPPGDYSTAGGNDVAGHWSGVIDLQKPWMKLRLAIHIARTPQGTFSALLDSLDQGVRGMQATEVQVVGDNVRAQWKRINGAFEGRTEDGKLTGTWFQARRSSPVVFDRTPE